MARRRERDPRRDEAPAALPRDPFGRREARASARLDFLFDARRMDPECGAVRPQPVRAAPAAPPRDEAPEPSRDPPAPPSDAPPPDATLLEESAAVLVEEDAAAAIDLDAPRAEALSIRVDATPPPFLPPPLEAAEQARDVPLAGSDVEDDEPPKDAEGRGERERHEPLNVAGGGGEEEEELQRPAASLRGRTSRETDRTRGSRLCGSSPAPRGFKLPGARYGAAAFVPEGLVAAAEVAACLALGLIARLFSRREA